MSDRLHFFLFAPQPQRLSGQGDALVVILRAFVETYYVPGFVPGTSHRSSRFVPFLAKAPGLEEVVSFVQSPTAGTGQRQESNAGLTAKCMDDKNKCVVCTWRQASPHFVSPVALFPDTPEPYPWTITERPALESAVPPACPSLGHRESLDREEGRKGES